MTAAKDADNALAYTESDKAGCEQSLPDSAKPHFNQTGMTMKNVRGSGEDVMKALNSASG